MADKQTSAPAKRRKGGKPSTALPTKRRRTKSASSNNGSDSNDSSMEIDPSSWAPEFRQLEQVFRSLNTVYTFCCTRKHFPTTFENLKSSVENLTRRYLFLFISAKVDLFWSMISFASKRLSRSQLILTTLTNPN